MTTVTLPFSLDEHLILKVKTGSHAYGIATEDSDEDFRGIIIPPEEYFTGLRIFKQFCPDPNGPWGDVVYYDIRKFLALAMKGNPSILEMFHAPRLRVFHPFMDTLFEMWPQILSKNLVTAHLGMAKAHLKRIQYPSRNCGVKGKKAIELYGYNTKDAAHIMRALNQCIEILQTSSITFPRPEAQELLDIKKGRWSIEKVRDTANKLINKIKDLEGKSELSNKPNFELVNRNCVNIVYAWICHKRCGNKNNILDREKGNK